jgi:hypothetical protein
VVLAKALFLVSIAVAVDLDGQESCVGDETPSQCVERIAQGVAANAVSAPGRSALKDFLSTASITPELLLGRDPKQTLSLEYGFLGIRKPFRLQVVLEKPDVSAAVKHIAGDSVRSLSITDDVHAALSFNLVTRGYGRSIVPHRALTHDFQGAAHDLGVLLDNQPQLYFTVDYHLRNNVAGPREIGAALGWEFSQASLNEFLSREGRDCEPNCVAALERFMKRVPGADRTPRLSISAEFRRTLQSTPELSPEMTTSSFTTMRQEGFLYAARFGAGWERRFDLGVTYDTRSDERSEVPHFIPPTRERLTATATYTQRISERFATLLSLVWDDRSEWLPERCRMIIISPQVPLCDSAVHRNNRGPSLQVGINYKFPSFGRITADNPVRWSPEVILPIAPVAMPVFAETPSLPPIPLMNRLLHAEDRELKPFPHTSFAKMFDLNGPESVLAATEDDHQKGWVDRSSGDAAFYASFRSLSPLTGELPKLVQAAKSFFRSPDFDLEDDTSIVIDDPRILMGTRGMETPGGGWSETPPERFLLYVAARRIVNNQWAVDGPGSRAVVAIGNDGSVVGFVRIWRRAKRSGTVSPRRNAAEIRSAIEAQLRQTTRIGSVTVMEVGLAYYDGNGKFLQPVYRFVARIHHTAESRHVDDYVVGYIPVAEELEPLPRLEAAEGSIPRTERIDSAPTEPAPGDPFVGRYVVRDDDAGWGNDAAKFWSALTRGPTAASFTDRQYFSARPEMFTSKKNTYVNAMRVSLVEAHGDWWSYSTKGCCTDGVKIGADIPLPGYGRTAGGELSTWILHGCEIVPAQVDTPDWAQPWRRLFGGIRNVIGYRTPIDITDGAGQACGESLSHGAPVISSWIQDVVSLSTYGGLWTRKAYAHGGPHLRPMGRASAISVCGHEDDSVFNPSPIAAATPCLSAWWLDD